MTCQRAKDILRVGVSVSICTGYSSNTHIHSYSFIYVHMPGAVCNEMLFQQWRRSGYSRRWGSQIEVDIRPKSNRWWSRSSSQLLTTNICLSLSPISAKHYKALEETNMQLSRVIQLSEIESRLFLWSRESRASIVIHGYSLANTDHIKLINVYLVILSIRRLNNLNVWSAPPVRAHVKLWCNLI